MKLDRAGREYAHFPATSTTGFTAFDVSFNDGTTWTAMDSSVAGVLTVLVAGPNATSNPAGTAALVLGCNTATIRATGSPEIVIRDAGAIDVS